MSGAPLLDIGLLVPDPFLKPGDHQATPIGSATIDRCVRSLSKFTAIALHRVKFPNAIESDINPKRHSQPSKLGQFESHGGFRQSERPLSCVASIWAGLLRFCHKTVTSVFRCCRCGFDRDQRSFENHQEPRKWPRPIGNLPRLTMASVHQAPKLGG